MIKSTCREIIYGEGTILPKGASPNMNAKRFLVCMAVCTASLMILTFAGYHVYTAMLIDRMGRLEPDSHTPQEVPTETMDPDYTGAVIDDPVVINDRAKNVEEITILGDTSHVTNFLLLGIDAEGNQGYVGRSDCIMILSINNNRGSESIRLISLLRDTCVPVSGYGPQKLNSAFSYGGYPLLLDTVKQQLRIKIERVIAVHFNAYRQAVNAIGGVDIELSADEAREIGIGRKADAYLLNGEKALEYARIRNIGNDWGRAERQRLVVQAIAKKAKTMSLLTMNRVLFEVFPEIHTNLSAEEIKGYIGDASTLLNYPIIEGFFPEMGTFTDPFINGVGRALVMNNMVETVCSLQRFLYE